jgi:hypothetical protein
MVHMRNGMANCGYAARSELINQTTKQRNMAITAEAEELYADGESLGDVVCSRALRPAKWARRITAAAKHVKTYEE